MALAGASHGLDVGFHVIDRKIPSAFKETNIKEVIRIAFRAKSYCTQKHVMIGILYVLIYVWDANIIASNTLPFFYGIKSPFLDGARIL
ncbi:hypothetical protein VNO77_05653 [Canavalia gladiata]|uniref:Uncharacterized protein n=1 Tax=Canavalia gladiata TaxID=3824 RepID=A0AAN9MYS1_CANGL